MWIRWKFCAASDAACVLKELFSSGSATSVRAREVLHRARRTLEPTCCGDYLSENRDGESDCCDVKRSCRRDWDLKRAVAAIGVRFDMRLTCAHAIDMSRMVQIRNVPDALHRKLKARAADSGRTLSDYLLAELERLAARPTREDMLARLHSRKRVTLKTPAASIIREERDSA
jgi:antitoxin FitA